MWFPVVRNRSPVSLQIIHRTKRTSLSVPAPQDWDHCQIQCMKRKISVYPCHPWNIFLKTPTRMFKTLIITWQNLFRIQTMSYWIWSSKLTWASLTTSRCSNCNQLLVTKSNLLIPSPFSEPPEIALQKPVK